MFMCPWQLTGLEGSDRAASAGLEGGRCGYMRHTLYPSPAHLVVRCARWVVRNASHIAYHLACTSYHKVRRTWVRCVPYVVARA